VTTVERLIERHPQLYHMAEDGAWPSIMERGLLPTSMLLDLFGVNGQERAQVEREQRRQKVALNDPAIGSFVVRDQKPLPESKLATCLLDGLTPADWYAILNERVFFWLTPKRLETLLRARAYRSEPQTLITVDTAELLERHHNRVELSPINSGAVMPIARPRGLATFRSIADYDRDEIAELSVKGGVPDIFELTVMVERREPGGARTLLYAR
jgi:hypothetical protein